MRTRFLCLLLCLVALGLSACVTRPLPDASDDALPVEPLYLDENSLSEEDRFFYDLAYGYSIAFIKRDGTPWSNGEKYNFFLFMASLDWFPQPIGQWYDEGESAFVVPVDAIRTCNAVYAGEESFDPAAVFGDMTAYRAGETRLGYDPDTGMAYLDILIGYGGARNFLPMRITHDADTVTVVAGIWNPDKILNSPEALAAGDLIGYYTAVFDLVNYEARVFRLVSTHYTDAEGNPTGSFGR